MRRRVHDRNSPSTGRFTSTTAVQHPDPIAFLAILLLPALLVTPERASAAYTDIGAGLPGTYDGSAAWGDYDADGDLDILLTGSTESDRIAGVFRNDGGSFVNITAPLLAVSSGGGEWGDYDNDGDLDILLTGNTGSSNIARIYRNDGGEFAEAVQLLGVRYSSTAWGDYDNDGDLDIVLTGHTGSTISTRIYQNDFGSFRSVGTPVPGVRYGAVAWGDYKNDGDIDILITGDAGSTPVGRIYNNVDGTFSEVIGTTLPPVDSSSVAWGDYDGDGDMDILVAGDTGAEPLIGVFRNDGVRVFVGTTILSGQSGVRSGAVAWGDHDNDGDLDILAAGCSSTGPIARIYKNANGTFTDAAAGLPGVLFASAAWGDYDNDGDLDILLAGDTGQGLITHVYRSDGARANEPPNAPDGLASSVDPIKVTLSWNAATDVETPSAALSYNLRVGTTPGGSDLVSVMADASTGFRRVPALGNAQQVLEHVFDPIAPGLCYWSVQAINASFAGSGFAAEGTFVTMGYEDIGAGLPDLTRGTVDWGDYDGDGDLDLLVSGRVGTTKIARIYRNDEGVFTDLGADQLMGVTDGAADWVDFDNDGDLDAFLTGTTDMPLQPAARIYRNDEGTFELFVPGFLGINYGDAAWGDYDNDGDLDAVLTGWGPGNAEITRLYRNDGSGIFSEVTAGLINMNYSMAAWGDYDNDGDLDLALAGHPAGTGTTRLYRNDGGTFVLQTTLPQAFDGAVAWGDYDNDGDLDLLVTGSSEDSGYYTRIYRNSGSSFESLQLADLRGKSAAWGDYDNDGDLDFLVTGQKGGVPISTVYWNDAGEFKDITAGLHGGGVDGAVAWGDYDNDDDLDIVVSGDGSCRIYRCVGPASNTPPSAPTGLVANVAPTLVTLSWNAATDAETPASGLTYNVRVGATPGGSEIMSAMADAATGRRHIVASGNAQQRMSWTLAVPSTEWRYWSVQAIDATHGGSQFAPEQDWTATDVESGSSSTTSGAFSLLANEPNPFRATTKIAFALPSASRVALAIYDPSGRRVRTLIDEERPAGSNQVVWNGADARGNQMPAGVYFYELRTGALSGWRRMVLIR